MKAVAASRRSSALVRGCAVMRGRCCGIRMCVPPLTSSTPRRRMSARRFTRDQLRRPLMTAPAASRPGCSGCRGLGLRAGRAASRNRRSRQATETSVEDGHFSPKIRQCFQWALGAVRRLPVLLCLRYRHTRSGTHYRDDGDRLFAGTNVSNTERRHGEFRRHCEIDCCADWARTVCGI